jgi:hypothetical protein
LPDGILVGTYSSHQWTDGLIILFLLFGNELGQLKLNVFVKKILKHAEGKSHAR